MAPSPLRFCLDYLSPYAYLAWLRMPDLAARHGRTVEPVPVLLAGLLNAVGSIGPAEIPPKRVYVFKQTLRIAHEQGAPFTLPPSHPFNPLLSLRVTAAVDDVAERSRVVTALYAACWGQGRSIESPEDVGAVLDAAGLDAEALLAAAGTPEVKERLKRNTEEALAQGTFGVPSVLVDGEMFWGVDSLGHLERFLEGRDPLTPEALERWNRLPATAARGGKAPAVNVLTQLGVVVAGLVLAGVLLTLNFWRALLFLFPGTVRVEPEAPADQMDLPDALAATGAQLQALGFTPLGSHEEKPLLQKAVRSYDWAHPGERVFATVYQGTDGLPRLYLLTPLGSGGFVVTASYRRPALDLPGYRSGSLEDAAPERLLRAHVRRLEGLEPVAPGDFSWEGRVEAGRSWYQGLGRKEIRRQNLQGLLWTAIALAIVASSFLGRRAG